MRYLSFILVFLSYGLNANGTSISLTSGPLVNETFTIPTTILSTGIHFLYIRALDENGLWSVTENRAFVIQAIPTIPIIATDVVDMEFFIDTEPGPGNGTPISITQGPVVNVNTTIDVSTVSTGLHFLFIRVQDDLGLWGLAEKRAFQVSNSVSLLQKKNIKIEYFFDNDPGVGSGTQIDVSPVDVLNLDTALLTSTLPIGPHDLGIIRVQDEQGTWSVTDINSVNVCNGPNPGFTIDLNCAGLITNFTDNSLDVVAGDIYRWDFDGDKVFEINTMTI